jgi:hypothetical protein
LVWISLTKHGFVRILSGHASSFPWEACQARGGSRLSSLCLVHRARPHRKLLSRLRNSHGNSSGLNARTEVTRRTAPATIATRAAMSSGGPKQAH